MAGLVAAFLIVTPVAVPVAGAQTGYPPGPCTVTVSSQAFGSATVGTTVTLVLAPTCVWAPGGPVEVLVNGQTVGTKTALSTGFVSVTITVLSAATLSVDDPVLVPAVCGTNSVIGRGRSTVAGGAVVTHQASFTVVCPAATAIPVPTQRFAFTGANVSRWLAAALIAVVGGGVFLVAGRRRKTSVTA